MSESPDFDVDSHGFFMGLAIEEARWAARQGEVPVGAVLVLDGEVIGRGYNSPIGTVDPTAHAEILALREGAKRIGNYRLKDTTLYVTIEPCAMCAGALVHARVGQLVYGAAEVRAGGVESVFQICSNSSLNHQVRIVSGVREVECRDLMQAFFKARR